ncbi:MAG: hypothetical protein ACFCU8_16590 [Thermosynechococcaceae cyanobacterium]
MEPGRQVERFSKRDDKTLILSGFRDLLFLPFADDPKTTEVISKTLLLARDHAIQDPTILEQLL